jgi:hypothetical protein
VRPNPFFTKHDDFNRMRGEIVFPGTLDRMVGIEFTKRQVNLDEVPVNPPRGEGDHERKNLTRTQALEARLNCEIREEKLRPNGQVYECDVKLQRVNRGNSLQSSFRPVGRLKEARPYTIKLSSMLGTRKTADSLRESALRVSCWERKYKFRLTWGPSMMLMKGSQVIYHQGGLP